MLYKITKTCYNIPAMLKNNKTKEYRPRVIVRGNTGTRIIASRKDKQNSRQSLKRALAREW